MIYLLLGLLVGPLVAAALRLLAQERPRRWTNGGATRVSAWHDAGRISIVAAALRRSTRCAALHVVCDEWLAELRSARAARPGAPLPPPRLLVIRLWPRGVALALALVPRRWAAQLLEDTRDAVLVELEQRAHAAHGTPP